LGGPVADIPEVRCAALHEAEHEAFRAMVRDFLAKELLPHHAFWQAIVDAVTPTDD
jgi:hypothetical protein